MVFIVVLSFFSIVLVTVGAYWYVRYRQDIGKRLQRIADSRAAAEEKATPSSEWLLRLIEWFSRVSTPKKEEEVSSARMRLIKAGYRKPQAVTFFYGAKALLAVLMFVLFTFLRLAFFRALPHLQIMFFSILSAVVGFYLPDLWIRLVISRRREAILKAFPDALDLLVTCAEAGLGLDAAINRVSEEIALSSPELSDEFNLMALELRAGKPRPEAMKGLALRTELEEVSSLVTLLIQTDRFGTSVAQALRVHSDAMRIRRRQKAEELAAKMSVKMLFPLILFIFPAILLVVVGPGIIRIARTLMTALGGR